MQKRRFYTFSCWYGCSCKGLFLSCGDIWCSILVYHHLFAVCALLVSLVVCCAACSLIMRYRANNSPSCLLVVHIRQRAFNMVLVLLVRLKGIISPVWSSCFIGALWGCLLVGLQCGIISSACKAFISFLLHVLLFGGRLCAPSIYEVIRRGFICSCVLLFHIEVIRIRQRTFHFERLKLCLISAVVVLLVQI